MATKSIPRAKAPQSVGVSAKVVNDFFKNAKEKNLEYHSLMVIRNGKVAVEWYNEPFDKNTAHSVYSVSKSFTSTAIGFAIEEGYFNIDTRFVEIFPELRGEKLDEYLEELKGE